MQKFSITSSVCYKVNIQGQADTSS